MDGWETFLFGWEEKQEDKSCILYECTLGKNIKGFLSLTQEKDCNAFNFALGGGEKVDWGNFREKWKTVLIGIGRGVGGMFSHRWSH